MSKKARNFERVTISLPAELLQDMEEIQSEMRVPMSEIFKKSMNSYVKYYRKNRLKKTAEMMAEEYQSNEELTSFTDLDSEDFRR